MNREPFQRILDKIDVIHRAQAHLNHQRETLRRAIESRLRELFPVGMVLDLHPTGLLALERPLRALLFGMRMHTGAGRLPKDHLLTVARAATCTLTPDPTHALWAVECVYGTRGVSLSGTVLDATAVAFLDGRGKPYTETLSGCLDGNLA